MIPTVARHPLRHAAARGRLAARHRRGRRPRHLRLQVPRRRPGRAGAGRRGRRRRAGAPDRAAHPAAGGARPGPRDRALRGRRGGAGPAQRQPGLNLGVDFLPGAFGYDGQRADPAPGSRRPAGCCGSTRSCANVDRSWRNPNLLVWHGDLWVIDHGAALYFHHAWAGGVGDPQRFAAQPWDVTDHVLRDHAGDLAAVDRAIAALLDEPACSTEVLAAGAGRLARAGAGRRDAGRSCGRRTSRSSPPGSAPALAAGPGRWRRERRGLPVRRAAVRPAARPRGVRQRRGGALLRGAASSTSPGGSTPTGSRPLDPRARPRRRSAPALEFVAGVCAGDPAGGAAAGQPLGSGSASSRRRAAP